MLYELFLGSGLCTTGFVVKYFHDVKKLQPMLRWYAYGHKSIEVIVKKHEYQPPVYISASQVVQVPIGGGNEETKKVIYRNTWTADATLEGYENVDMRGPVTKEYYVNTMKSLEELLQKHKIPESTIPITLPIIVREHHYNDNSLYGLQGVVGSDRKTVAKRISYLQNIDTSSFFLVSIVFGVTGFFVFMR